jgi:hypothetical protein
MNMFPGPRESSNSWLPVLGRALAVITVIGSILWLYLDKPPRERRIRDLDRALASHAVGRLNASGRRRLQEVVGEMLKALDIPAQAAVDEPFRGDRLNIYTTSTAAAVVTGCGPGNALYDPGLDAIFIDEEFFNFEGYREIYNASAYGSVVSFNENLVFPEIYLRFVILHELGHRQLHRGIGGYRPHVTQLTPQRLRALEREADRFAVTGMKTFYAFDKAHPAGFVGPPLKDAVGLSDFFDSDVSPAAQVYIDLVGTLFLMANAELYLGTPYSPFFESPSHPTFLDRARGAIDAVLENKDLAPKLQANFLFLRESLGREALVGNEPFTEVIVPEPVNDVSFDDSEVLIASVGNRRVFGVSGEALNFKGGSSGRQVLRSAPKTPTGPSSGSEPNRGFWTRPDHHSLLIDSEGAVWEFFGARMVPSALSLPSGLTTRGCFHLLTPPQPTEKAVVTACDAAFTQWLVSFRNDRRTAERSEPDILRDLTQRLGHPLGGFEISALGENDLYLALNDTAKEKHLIGSARLSVSSLQVEEAITFKSEKPLSPDHASDRVWPFLIAEGDGHDRHFLLAGRDVRGPSVTAWELFAEKLPKPVSDQSLLVRQVPPQVTPDLIADFDPFVEKTWMLTPTKSLVYLANDSLYLFDAARAQFQIVFHPAFEGIDVRLGRQGRWAVFMRGGSRLFLFKSP